MRRVVVFSILSLNLILTACGSSDESGITPIKSGKKIEDIHGVGVLNDGTTYVATHEGLFSIKSDESKWNKVGSS
ncbi:MAG TPA: hypothetical protein VK190_11565, partial [Pseudoneobacillus sp.]|nr:hypothetical protein [Pseudoneobacillus sp.]